MTEAACDRHFHSALFLLSGLIPDDAIRARPEGLSDGLLRLRLRAEKLSFLPNLLCAWESLITKQRYLKSPGDFLAAYSPRQLAIEGGRWQHYFASPLINYAYRLFSEFPLRTDVLRSRIQRLGAKPGERGLIYATSDRIVQILGLADSGCVRFGALVQDCLCAHRWRRQGGNGGMGFVSPVQQNAIHPLPTLAEADGDLVLSVHVSNSFRTHRLNNLPSLVAACLIRNSTRFHPSSSGRRFSASLRLAGRSRAVRSNGLAQSATCRRKASAPVEIEWSGILPILGEYSRVWKSF